MKRVKWRDVRKNCSDAWETHEGKAYGARRIVTTRGNGWNPKQTMRGRVVETIRCGEKKGHEGIRAQEVTLSVAAGRSRSSLSQRSVTEETHLTVTGKRGRGSPVSGIDEYVSESSLLKRNVPPIKVRS
jgi:hypothetical protein